MSFASYAYAIFLPIVFLIYWILPAKFRWILLLVASYYFYMSWNPKYVVLIIFTTVVSYFSARGMEKATDRRNRKLILTVCAVSCLGVLFLFKYYNFFAESVAVVFQQFSLPLSPALTNFVLPVGISFYTFQTLSYVVDVYRGDLKAERHFGYYAAYVSFFPQLVAGPIERAGNLLPQLKKKKHFEYEMASYGLKQMAWGYFKKIVIADTLAVFVGSVFEQPQDYHGMTLLLATLGFTIQIYCDFSGYSDIAIGTARLFGIRLMDNFRSPYFSASIKEFWKRWHISLSTWMRDYVYIPLGGNRVGRFRHSVNLMVTFLVSGLWHGANWTFVAWGGIHGAAQVVENFLPINTQSTGLRRWVKVPIVFLICAFAWIFFASNTFGDAFYIIGHMFEGISDPVAYLKAGTQTNLSWETIRCLFVSFGILAVFDYFSLKKDVIYRISELRKPLRWGIYVAFLVWLLMNIQLAEHSEFIYFQF